MLMCFRSLGSRFHVEGARVHTKNRMHGDELRTIISLNRSVRELDATTTYMHLGSKCRPICGSPESLTSPQSSRELYTCGGAR